MDYETIRRRHHPSRSTPICTLGYRGLNESLPCYTTEKSEFLTFDAERARAALTDSLYGSAEALPPIRITTNTTWPVMINVVEAIVEQWRVNLNITDVQIVDQPWSI